MVRKYFFMLCFIMVVSGIGAINKTPFKTLIITGQNNHNWVASSPILAKILDQTGLFQTDLVKTPEKEGDMSLFHPDFSKYQLVVIDYNGDSWSDETKTAFVNYVKNGGGVVIYHASDNAFSDWNEYNQMIGLGGWGNRTEKDGPYVYFKDGKRFTDNSPGKGGSHGKRTPYKVTNRVTDHPITKGLPVEWLHAEDELYSNLRGPAENMEILATALSNSETGGSGKEEPILITIKFGKGRIFHTVMGHCGNNDTEFPALECAGFIVTFQRGAEWAASGDVKQKVPVGFPDEKNVTRWEGYKR